MTYGEMHFSGEFSLAVSPERFVTFDCVLQAILQDLFPGVDIPEHDYGRLQAEIISVQEKNKLQVVMTQVKKVIQLYETMIVRHGVMLVGPTGSGKTTVYQVWEHKTGVFFS